MRFRFFKGMAQCNICNAFSKDISKEVGVCLKCIRERPQEALAISFNTHKRSREAFGLPAEPPKALNGIACNLCVNECMIPEGSIGYCGLRINKGGKLIGVAQDEGKLSWYHDPLPTNCVGDWVCPGGTGAGYPKYAYSKGVEHGFLNLAVFFHACSFNCLFCQNWQFKKETHMPHTISVRRLAEDVNSKTSCICYFGGDPGPQLPFAIKASKLAIEANKNRILRICWETNGSMHEGLLREMIKLSLDSGGCIKFDLKAWDENLHKVLTGVTNKRTIENFRIIGEYIISRVVPPLLIANTLLVPGYIDEEEVRAIAKFVASISPEIPYSLLAFYPHFYMSDMPLTKREDADRYLKAAKEEGLKNVRVGNIHLLR